MWLLRDEFIVEMCLLRDRFIVENWFFRDVFIVLICLVSVILIVV